MVTIKLMGGIGNVLFQIAAAYAYAKKTNKELKLTTNDFNVVHKHLDSYKENILHNVDFLNNYNTKGFKSFTEPGFNFTEIPNINGNVMLIGYFQAENYFKDYLGDIKKLFEFPLQIVNNVSKVVKTKYKIDMLADNICSIHVRRGDYLKSPDHHPAQSLNYYMKAMKKIGMDKKFLVFSDDIEWCKNNFPDMDNLTFVEDFMDYEDLCLMSLCNHNIICNSTFSWWSAFLNKNPKKKIIAPSIWFGKAYANYNIKDLYCEDWKIV